MKHRSVVSPDVFHVFDRKARKPHTQSNKTNLNFYIQLLESYLSRVALEEAYSRFYAILIGVPQGKGLGHVTHEHSILRIFPKQNKYLLVYLPMILR